MRDRGSNSNKGARTLVQEVGNWVSGDRFWDRDIEIASLIRLLSEGAHVSIVAPRRVGKTSLMREVAGRLTEEFTCLQVDLQKARHAGDAVVELSLATRPHRGLWSRTKEVFRNVLEEVDEMKVDDVAITLRSGVTGEWQRRGDRLLDAIASGERPCTDEFVSWLRAATRSSVISRSA